jgi:ACS family sodium-dependent inorganic phosphate cotransporter-like MFS transporter 5
MMGSVIAMPISGVLCQHGFAGGWGSIFYVIGECCEASIVIDAAFCACSGIASMFAVILWLLLTSNTPSQHRFISKAEKKYITNSLKGQVSETGNDVSLSFAHKTSYLFMYPPIAVVRCAMAEICDVWACVGHYCG